MKTSIQHKLALILTVLTFCAMQLNAQTTPVWTWAKNAGGTQDDYAGGTDYNGSTVATDAFGNSYVTGLFRGTATFGSISISGPAYPNVFVAKYDSSGNCLWVKKFGGNSNDTYGNQGNAIALDAAGNCYVTGTFAGSANFNIAFGTSTLICSGARQIFVVKYDAAGNELWARQGNSGGNPSNNYAKSISADAAGNCYITGYLGSGNVTFGNVAPGSGAGGYVVKFNASGVPQWATKLGASGGTDPNSINCKANGQCYVTGYVQGNETITTNPVTSFTTGGMRDVFVCNVAANGNINWYKHFGGNNSNATAYGKGIGCTPNGHIFLTGDFNGNLNLGSNTFTNVSSSNSNCFIAYLDSLGNPIWSKQTTSSGFGGGYFSASGLKINQAGTCYFTGNYSTSGSSSASMGTINFPSIGNQMFYVLKTDALGNLGWGMFSSGQGSSAYSAGIGCDNLGNIVVAGFIQVNCSIGSTSLTAFGGMDVLLARIRDAALSPTLTTQLEAYSNAQGISLYPNPFNEQLSIDVKNSNNTELTFTLFDVLGKAVKSLPVVAGEVTKMNREELNSGIYFYRIESGEKIISGGKLIIE